MSVKTGEDQFYKLDARRSTVNFGKRKMKLAENCLELGSNGKIQTIYLNSKSSKVFTKCYDKKEDINRKREMSRKRKKLKKDEVKLITEDRTRIEVVYQRDKYYLSKLPELKCPTYQLLVFNQDIFSRFPKKWEFDAWRSLFMDACARRGFHNAVRALPKNRHRSIRDILLKSAPYIDLEPIFLDQWPRVLKKLDFLQM